MCVPHDSRIRMIINDAAAAWLLPLARVIWNDLGFWDVLENVCMIM